MPHMKKTIVLLAVLLAAVTCARSVKVPPVYLSNDASGLERLAASEVRRYLYVTTGGLAAITPIASLAEAKTSGLIIDKAGALLASGGFDDFSSAKIPALGPEDYWLKTLKKGGQSFLFIAGGDGPGVLYAAYAFAEKLGVRFYLDGDVVPDERIAFRDARPRRDGPAPVPAARHPAVPRFSRGAGLVERGRLQGRSWASCPSCG